MLHSKPRSWAGTCDVCFRDVGEGEPYHAGPRAELYCLPCALTIDLAPNVNRAATQEGREADERG